MKTKHHRYLVTHMMFVPKLADERRDRFLGSRGSRFWIAQRAADGGRIWGPQPDAASAAEWMLHNSALSPGRRHVFELRHKLMSDADRADIERAMRKAIAGTSLADSISVEMREV